MNLIKKVKQMAKWTYKGGKWFKNKGGFQGFSYSQDTNVVKIVKPQVSYIPIRVTLGIYQPSTKALEGNYKMTLNLCTMDRYCETTIFGKPEVKTAIKQDNEYIYILETWKQLDDLVEAALKKYGNKILPTVKVKDEVKV